MISEGRQSHLAQVIVNGLWQDEMAEYANDDQAHRFTRGAISRFVAELEGADQKARQMVASLKRDVREGTPEWDVMYQKYLEEELNRRGGQ